MQNNAIDHDRKVQDGLDIILNHFQEPQFPRKIMTKQLDYQVEVFNKQEALKHFNNSNYEDCRINAYPSFTEYQGYIELYYNNVINESISYPSKLRQ